MVVIMTVLADEGIGMRGWGIGPIPMTALKSGLLSL
jgi:hypothetical protein